MVLSSRLTFTNPDKDDLGRYSVDVTDTDGVSSSHTVTEDGESHFYNLLQHKLLFLFVAHVVSWPLALNTMLELSHSIRHPSEYRLAAASLSSLLLLGVSPFTCLLSVYSRAAETRSELRGFGERTRTFLAPGCQTVPVRIVQIHR